MIWRRGAGAPVDIAPASPRQRAHARAGQPPLRVRRARECVGLCCAIFSRRPGSIMRNVLPPRPSNQSSCSAYGQQHTWSAAYIGGGGRVCCTQRLAAVPTVVGAVGESWGPGSSPKLRRLFTFAPAQRLRLHVLSGHSPLATSTIIFSVTIDHSLQHIQAPCIDQATDSQFSQCVPAKLRAHPFAPVW